MESGCWLVKTWMHLRELQRDELWSKFDKVRLFRQNIKKTQSAITTGVITCYQLSLLTQSSCFGLWARSHKRGGTEHKKSLFSACEFIWLCSAFFCTVQHPSGVTWIQLNRLHVAICMTFKACFKLKESLNAHDLFPDHGMCSALAVMTCHIKESACVVTLNTLALGSTYLPHSLISLYRRAPLI